MNSVTAANGNGAQAGYASRQVPNPDLKWEANKTFNVGIDFGFLNQRITFSPEFYINRSSNLLLNAKLPNSSGYTSMVIKAGETQNSGVDLTIIRQTSYPKILHGTLRLLSPTTRTRLRN